jgi:hypothetical protein
MARSSVEQSDWAPVKGAYETAGNTWKSAYSDIGNTYQAVLTQDAGWHAKGNASEPLCDPLTESVAQESGMQPGSDMMAMQKQGTKVLYNQDMYKANNPSPDSGYGPGKSDPGMDRG